MNLDLGAAIRSGDVGAVQQIVAADPGSRYRFVEYTSWTPVVYAIIYGTRAAKSKTELIESLIDDNVLRTATTSEAIELCIHTNDIVTMGAMYAAANKANIDILSRELRGFYTEGGSVIFLTPLLYAIYHEKKDMVTWFLENGASVDDVARTCPDGGPFDQLHLLDFVKAQQFEGPSQQSMIDLVEAWTWGGAKIKSAK